MSSPSRGPGRPTGPGASTGVVTIVLRRMAVAWPVVGAAFVAATLAATLLAAAPIYAGAAAQAGLEQTLRSAPPAEAGIEVSRRVSSQEYEAASSAIRSELDATLGSAGSEPLRHAESDSFALVGETRTVLSFYSDLEQAAELVDGRWPRAGTGGELEAVISSPGARAAGVEVGELVRLDESLSVRITGIYAVADPAAPSWWGEPLALAGVRGRDVTTAGPLVASEQAFRERVGRFRASWRVVPRPEEIPVADVSALQRELEELESRLQAGAVPGSAVTVRTGLGGLLAGAERSLVVARSSVIIPLVQLALLAGYGLVFAGGLLRRRRESEAALLRARGAGARQLATLAGLEALAVCLPAGLAAPWLAAFSLRALAELGPTAGLDLAPRVDRLAQALALAGAAACAAALVLPALRAPHGPGAARRRIAGFVEQSGLDLALLLAAAVALWQLRRYGSPLLEGAGGRLRVDPLLVAAPAIGLVAGAIVAARVVPAALRLLERAGAARSGPVLALAGRRLARSPAEYRPAALLLVIGLAIGTFAAAYGATWTSVQEARAQLRSGSDVLAVPDRRTGGLPEITLARAYRSLPGVRSATPVLRETVSLGGVAEAPFLAVGRSLGDTGADAALLGRLQPEGTRLPGLALEGDPRALELLVHARLLPAPPVDPRVRGLSPLRPPGFGRFRMRPTDFDTLAPRLSVVVRDAAGLVHRLGGAELRAGSQRLRVELAPSTGDGPDYPLELVAVELVVTAPSVSARTLVLEVTPPGGRADLRAAGWEANVTPVGGPITTPSAQVEASASRLRLVLDTGSTVLDRPSLTVSFAAGGRAEPGPLPVIAGAGLLEAIGARVGDVVEIDLAGAARPVRIVGASDRFPTVTEGIGDSFLVADASTLADELYRTRGLVLRPSAWLVDADPGQEDAVTRALEGAPFASSDVIGRTRLARSLAGDPLAVATRGALWLGFAAAALFAPAAFALAAAARRREHQFELAALRAAGVGRRALTRMLVVEGAAVVAIATALGLAVGVLLSYLVLPAVAFTETGAPAVPAPIVQVPWPTVAALAAGVGTVLLVTVALDARRTGRSPAPEALRAGAAA